MELHEKLKHLSNREVEEVIELYETKSVKISDIIEKYKIDVKPASLLKILPYKVTDVKCPYCKIPMLQQRVGRSTCFSGNVFCEHCGHENYSKTSWRYWECSCTNCKEKRAEEIRIKQRQIMELYGAEPEQKNFNNIEFCDQLDLINLMQNHMSYKSHEILYKQRNWADSKGFLEKVNRLLQKKYLTISPYSEMEAFDKADFPHNVNLLLASFKINVEFTEENRKELSEKNYFKKRISKEMQIEVLKELIYKDAINQFSKMLEKRNLQLVKLEKADEEFRKLIDKISYTQLIALCERVAKFYSDKVLTNEMSRNPASRATLKSVSSFYQKSLENGWNLRHSEYEYAGDELKNYVTNVLGKKLELLKYVPSIDSLNDVEDVERDYTKHTRVIY